MMKILSKRALARLADESALRDAEPADHALYAEYTRGLEAVPTLEDAVRIPPRPSTPPSFVRGERRSLRKAERPDPYALRESQLAALEQQYQEYLAPAPASPQRQTPRKRKKRSAGARKPK